MSSPWQAAISLLPRHTAAYIYTDMFIHTLSGGRSCLLLCDSELLQRGFNLSGVSVLKIGERTAIYIQYEQWVTALV